MAGSYRHIVNDDGTFAGTELLDNWRDVYEALEECYDMIQFLTEGDPERIAQAWLEGHLRKSRLRYGVEISPEATALLLAGYWET